MRGTGQFQDLPPEDAAYVTAGFVDQQAMEITRLQVENADLRAQVKALRAGARKAAPTQPKE